MSRNEWLVVCLEKSDHELGMWLQRIALIATRHDLARVIVAILFPFTGFWIRLSWNSSIHTRAKCRGLSSSMSRSYHYQEFVR